MDQNKRRGNSMKLTCVEFWLCAVLAVSSVSAIAASDTAELQRVTIVARVISKSVAEIDPSTLSEGERMRFVEALRPERHLGEYSIRLRDSDYMDQAIARWNETKGESRGLRNTLKGSASPWLIIPLGGALLHDGSVVPRLHPDGISGWSDLGFSHSTAVIIHTLLVTAPEISVDVKKWASQQRVNAPSLLEVIRHWWEANRENLEKERYDLLVPLPGVPAVNSKATAVTSGTPPPSAPPAQPVPATAVVDSPNVEPAGDSPWDWRWGAGVALIALTLLLVWFKRR